MKIFKRHAQKVIFCNSKSVLSYLCTNPINFSICLKAEFETHEELGHWTMVSLKQRFLSYNTKKIPLPRGTIWAFPFVSKQYQTLEIWQAAFHPCSLRGFPCPVANGHLVLSVAFGADTTSLSAHPVGLPHCTAQRLPHSNLNTDTHQQLLVEGPLFV